MKNIHLSALRLLAVYWIPIIAGILTIAIILTAATLTCLVAKDTLGPWATAMALGLYGLGLVPEPIRIDRGKGDVVYPLRLGQ